MPALSVAYMSELMESLPFRSQCKCACHDPTSQITAIHIRPCCRPDPARVVGIDLFGIMGLPVKDGEMPPPEFAIAWDPALVTPEQYAQLVEILGDIVRANGGAGVRRSADYDVEIKPKVSE